MGLVRLTSNNQNLFSSSSDYFPKYLTPEEKRDLALGLKDFPDNFQYYLHNKYQNEALQGDVWDEMTIVDFDSGKRRTVKGIIFSNSCDIDMSNSRSLPMHVTFAPLINMDKLIKLLQKHKSDQQIQDIINNIKTQEPSSFLYLPENSSIPIPESVIYLNDLHSMPLGAFISQSQKLITLSQQGFYLFLTKLSMHFCRFQENISRF